MSLKTFLLKKMIKSKMKGVPDEQIDHLIGVIEKNPDFFNNIAKEIKEKAKKLNISEEQASMSVMMQKKDEIAKLMR